MFRQFHSVGMTRLEASFSSQRNILQDRPELSVEPGAKHAHVADSVFGPSLSLSLSLSLSRFPPKPYVNLKP